MWAGDPAQEVLRAEVLGVEGLGRGRYSPKVTFGGSWNEGVPRRSVDTFACWGGGWRMGGQ